MLGILHKIVDETLSALIRAIGFKMSFCVNAISSAFEMAHELSFSNGSKAQLLKWLNGFTKKCIIVIFYKCAVHSTVWNVKEDLDIWHFDFIEGRSSCSFGCCSEQQKL